MTSLEQRLRETPFRDAPSGWRREILAAAERARRPWFLGLLWPHPYAWGALAACWVLIAALNLSGPRGPELYAVTPPGANPLEITIAQYIAYLQTRDAMLPHIDDAHPVVFELDPRKL